MKHGIILIICILATAVFADTVKHEFTLKDLKKLRKEAKEAEECVPDCLMKRSDVEKKMGMSNKGTCVDLCGNGRSGNEMYGRVCDVCRYEKKFGRKMYAITIKYSIWDGVSHAASFDWEEIDEKVEDTSAKDPDPDRDGICSPWVSQNGVLDEYGALCMGIDKCPNQAGSVDADGCPDEIPQPPRKFFVLEGVSFESGKATITQDSHISLMKIVNIMETFKEVTFKIVGHTDNLGSKEKNKRLSADRAAAVKNFLVENGISESRIVTSGEGGSQPVASNTTSEGRAQNRRIEFIRTDIK